MSDALLAAALGYAAKGIPVFPLQPGEKVPHKGTNGHKDATTDVVLLKAWWHQWPQSNIGMPTGPKSGWWIVDVDGDEGLRVLGQMLRRHMQDFSELPRVYTPRGGRHFWFRWPENARLTNSAGALGPHLDVRGDGGYVVLPPSQINGNEYLWEI